MTVSEGSASQRPLTALLSPEVIAVVGASRDPQKWGRRVLEYTHRAGFAGRLYGVTPAAADLGLAGVRTVPAMAQVGEQIDLAVLARPAAAMPDLVAECASLGVRAVLIPASGFGELGDEHKAAEFKMAEAARAAGMRVLGPNTFGLFVAAQGVNLTPREQIPAGTVALVTQSGNVAVALYQQAAQAGIGFSACVGVGNQIDVGFGDLLAHFAADAGTAAVAIYVEGLRGSGESFRAGLAACRCAGKPVIVLRGGRSAQASQAVATHTGSLSGDDQVWQCVLDEAGAVSVASTEALTDALAAVAAMPPGRRRVMVLTDGGGDSVLAIDAVAAAGLELAAPSAATRAALDRMTPPEAPRTERRNPVTLDTAGGVEDDPLLLPRCAEAAARDGGVDVVVIGGLFGGYPHLGERELNAAAGLVAIRDSGMPVVVQSAFAVPGTEPVQTLRRAGIPVFPTIDRLAAALAAAAGQPEPATALAAAAGQPEPATVLAGDAGRPGLAGDAQAKGRPADQQQPAPRALPVGEAAALLTAHEIALPRIKIVRTPGELAQAAAAISYPACLKIADPAVVHKSEVGGVQLGLAGPDQLTSGADELWDRFPGSPLLVMPSLPSGIELLVGTGADPVFGPFVLIGRGGIWAEFDPDVAIRLAPVSQDQGRAALLSLRCAAMLTGARGKPAADLGALAALVVRMSRLAVARPDLSVEINPVIAYPDGYAVADLRAVTAGTPRPAIS